MGMKGNKESGYFGRKFQWMFGDEAKDPQEAGQLRGYGTELMGQGADLRQSLFDRSNAFMQGNLDLGASPMFQAAKAINAQALQNAQQNIMESTPRGGALTQAMTDAEIQNALGLTAAGGDIAAMELQNAIQLGLGSAELASNMLATSGNLVNQISISNNQRRTERENRFGEMMRNIGSSWGGRPGGG